MKVNITQQEVLRFEHDGDFAYGEGPFYFQPALFILFQVVVVHDLDEFLDIGPLLPILISKIERLLFNTLNRVKSVLFCEQPFQKIKVEFHESFQVLIRSKLIILTLYLLYLLLEFTFLIL